MSSLLCIRTTFTKNLTLSSLPNSLNLPLLPKIKDSIIERKVFTHSSFYAKPKYSIQLFELEDESKDNEKLELLGDSLLDCAVVGLLQDLYPNLNPGTATLLKSHLVNNTILREICKLYHLNDRLIAPPEQLPTLKNGEKVLANLFEAYIAGVYYSYLIHGPNQDPSAASSSLRQQSPSPSPSLSSNPSSTSTSTNHLTPTFPIGNFVNGNNNKVTRGEAMNYLENWLRPLFQPISEHILIQMKNEQSSKQSLLNDEDLEIDKKSIGANSKLNQWFIAKESGMPEYASATSGTQGWKILCTAIDRSGKSWYGEATRSTKKAAMAVAAYKVSIQFERERPEYSA
ncbi:uncharacterized protein L201_006322 [Kwoniella dendrophila CBS 6074]|uniref:RNase III domain-containing protein n=1 Tax=Kwoniella dendrophila CBS 6074 TaxID=1295534 RepID=A0AAX4K1W0_9TREE